MQLIAHWVQLVRQDDLGGDDVGTRYTHFVLDNFELIIHGWQGRGDSVVFRRHTIHCSRIIIVQSQRVNTMEVTVDDNIVFVFLFVTAHCCLASFVCCVHHYIGFGAIFGFRNQGCMFQCWSLTFCFLNKKTALYMLIFRYLKIVSKFGQFWQQSNIFIYSFSY